MSMPTTRMTILLAVALVICSAMVLLTLDADLKPTSADKITSDVEPNANQPTAPSQPAPTQQQEKVEPTHRPATARSSALPSLTIEGAAADRLRRLKWGPGKYARCHDGLRSLDHVLASRVVNPEGKEPNEEQLAILDSLVREHAERIGKAYDAVWANRKQIMIKSAQAGRMFRSDMPTPNSLSPSDVRQVRPEANAKADSLRQQMLQSLGVAVRNLRYSSLGISEPDGVPRRILVYFTRDQEPQWFEQERQLKELEQRRRNAFHDFFERLN